jgi:hypothetical protein
VQVQLLPLIDDMAATHKVAGFASHSAKNFCSWCHVTNVKINKLQLGRARTAAEVQQSSDLWLKSSTQKLRRESIVRENGTRYSELNRLQYRNPVEHVALGMMHNWMEGVLMHHFCERWGFQTLSLKEKHR